MKRATPTSVDAYLSTFTPDIRQRLQQVRETIRKVAPGAEEVISYGIPAFRLQGRVIYFAGFKNHISVYPAPRTVPEFQEELAVYKGGKGTVQFPLNEKLPLDLIARIARFRLQEEQKPAPRKQQ
ncbi:MAG TPA: DUF1801 domain-containing protein [Flavisolibacter sp.]